MSSYPKMTFVWLSVSLLVILHSHSVKSIKRKFVPEDMLTLEEFILPRMSNVWNNSNELYALSTVETPKDKMREFTRNVRMTFSEIREAMKEYERKILLAQPNQMMNLLIDLNQLDELTQKSFTPSDDPVTNWKVKWVEVSSFATQINWMYDKRIRDILESIPYIKTVATSIALYYGRPWHSVLSGRNNETKVRLPVRYYTRLIEERIFSMPQGDLFFGLRKMLNESKSVKSGSATKTGTCASEELQGRIFPVHLDVPLYILYYLCMVDFKFYILENYFKIYKQVYENQPFANYTSSDDRLRARLRKKVNAYNVAFKNYKTGDSSLKKVMPGYYHCDPVSVDPNSDIRNHKPGDTFIRVTNFLTVFAELEKTLSPTGSCAGSCKDFAKGNDFCKSSDPKCMAKLHKECEANPSACEKFKPACPVEDLICFNSGMKVQVCHAEQDFKMYDWIDLDGKIQGPRVNNSECAQWTTDFAGTKETKDGKESDCEVCLCQCHEPILIQGNTTSVRKFSMLDVTSRVEENRVIVGMKFEQVGDQIHFMIADAISTPGFMYDGSTVNWIPANFTADDQKPENVQRLRKTLKTFHMDDIKANEGSVVTGIRFKAKPKPLRTPESEQEQYIGFAIQMTQVNPSTGDLETSSSEWFDNPESGKTSSVYANYVDPGDPVMANGPAAPDSTVDEFIEFRASSFTKDAGQHSIPFFDSQKFIVEGKVGYAIRGVGIFHRHLPGHGGFLGIKILPYGEYNPF